MAGRHGEGEGGSSKKRRIQSRKKKLALKRCVLSTEDDLAQTAMKKQPSRAPGEEEEHEQAIQEEDDVPANENIPARNCSSANKTQGYFTTHWFSQVVPIFTEVQKKIVESCGFKFLLFLPLAFKPEIRIQAYVTVCYDGLRNQMRLDNGMSFRVDREDLEIVMGLKDGRAFPENVWERPSFKHDVEEVARLFPQQPNAKVEAGLESISVKSARNFIYNLAGKTMDYHKCKIFRKAIVLVVVNDIIAPSRYHKEVDARLIHAIQDPDGPGVYDWAGYTIEAMKEAGATFKAQLESDLSGSTKYIGGCTLFLLLFYILRFVDCGIDYNTAEMPLIQHLPAKRIRTLLNQDEYKRIPRPSYKKVSTAKQLEADETKKRKMAKKEQMAAQDTIDWAELGYSKATGFADRDNLYGLIDEEFERIMEEVISTITSSAPPKDNIPHTSTNIYRAWLHQMAMRRLESNAIESQRIGYVGPLAAEDADNYQTDYDWGHGEPQEYNGYTGSVNANAADGIIILDDNVENENDALDGLMILGSSSEISNIVERGETSNTNAIPGNGVKKLTVRRPSESQTSGRLEKAKKTDLLAHKVRAMDKSISVSRKRRIHVYQQNGEETPPAHGGNAGHQLGVTTTLTEHASAEPSGPRWDHTPGPRTSDSTILDLNFACTTSE